MAMSDAMSALPPAAPGVLRPEAVSSAVSFLTDPKVASAPLSQRVSFLESKGLSASEIDAAMGQAQHSGSVARAPYAYPYPPPPQQQQARDWRDWFIMAVISGTIGYGVINLARKYLYPHLQPPNATILESDLEALTAKYDEVAAQLAALEDESAGIKSGLEAQREVVEASLKEVEEAVRSVRAGEKKRDDDMSDIKREVERIKDDMPRMFDKHRDAQTASLADVQAELKSLKALLVSRGAAASGSGIPARSTPQKEDAAPSPKPFSKPSIPAWQLAPSKDSNGTLNGVDPASE